MDRENPPGSGQKFLYTSDQFSGFKNIVVTGTLRILLHQNPEPQQLWLLRDRNWLVSVGIERDVHVEKS
jgi:hypothetical protein